MTDERMKDACEAADRRALHCALDNLLALWVREHGYDYNAVDAALAALALSPEMPVTAAFSDRVAQLRSHGADTLVWPAGWAGTYETGTITPATLRTPGDEDSP